MKIRLALVAFPLVALALVGCRSANSSESNASLMAVDEYSAQGRHTEALLAAESYRQSYPDDPRALGTLQRAKAAVMLEQAREDCFAERNVEALALIRQAREIEPNERVLEDWERKLKLKLANIHSDRGDEFNALRSLEAARDEYEAALGYNDSEARARAGLAQVLLHINYRRGMGEQYYEDGVGLLREYWLEQAKSRFQYVGKYQPDHDRAKSREKNVSAQLAASRCTLASDLERQGLWAAARNEYRIALLLDEEFAEAQAGLARTRVEASAEEKLREIERLIRAKHYDKAREAIDSGIALTKSQGDKFEGARASIEEAILESSYQTALTLEADQDYEDAIAAYDRLLAQREYYRDALARRDTLRAYVTKATALYQQAMDSTDPEEKLRFLRQIALFWPEYKNVEELIPLLKPAEVPR